MSFFLKRKSSQPPAMTLEGILGPNSRLDEVPSIRVGQPDAIAVTADGRLLFSSGQSIFALGHWGEPARPWAHFEHPVTALAASAGGRVAIGLSEGEVLVYEQCGKTLDWAIPSRPSCVGDCLFLSEDELAVLCHGYTSAQDPLSIAPWDEGGHGSVAAFARSGGERSLSRGLHCPMGLCFDERGQIVITELDAGRVIDVSGGVRRSGFPGYLGRIRKIPGGYLLACLSRRDPLIDFLKTEKQFVTEMKATIESRHWISPRATPEFSHEFPIELGATRLFSEIKPWAPSFSYGLLIMLDENLMPTGSAQSRANGRRHAISDATIWNGDMIAVSRASGEILNLGPGAPNP